MTAAPPSLAFDRKLDLERAVWLRRRFLWFCGASLVYVVAVVVPVEWPTAIGIMRHHGWRMHGVGVKLAQGAAGIVLAAAAFAYCWRVVPARAAVFRLTFWLVVLQGSLGLVGDWVAAGMSPGGSADGRYFDAGEIAWGFLLACLFLPWTPAEALRPGAVLLGVNAVLAACGVALGRAAVLPAALAVALSPLAVVPGWLVCRGRNTRFHRRFKLAFESEGYRHLQTELDGARRIHDSCMAAPRAGGPIRLSYTFEPMRQIGGDLLFVPPDGSRGPGVLNAVLLDVTGHGIAAALTVNRLVGELERVYGEDPDADPGKVLSALNRYVALTLARHGVYATALCLRADAAAGVVQWASAGHPPAFLAAARGTIEPLDSTCLLLGVLDGCDYDPEQAERPFGPGDAILAYTDGAQEAKDGRAAQFGVAGIRRWVEAARQSRRPPGEWPGELTAAVRRHQHGPPEDDTLIAAIYRPVG